MAAGATTTTATTGEVTQCTTVDLQHLADHGYVVVENFLPVSLQDGLRQDVKALRTDTDSKHFKIAKIGHDGMVQDENTPFRDIRYSETCFIGRTTNAEVLSNNKSRNALYDVLDSLKVELDTNSVVRKGNKTQQLPILDADLEEVMYAYYPQGGFYRRHKDAEADSISNIRKYSFLLYLNDADWNVERDGGALRIHRDAGGDTLPVGELPNFVDVAPKAGTLVLFRSDLVPHEVLDTRKERLAIVGWFLSEETASATVPAVDSTEAIHPEALAALRMLRDVSPRLAAKLKPAPPSNNSGMFMDDWSMPGAPAPEPEKVYPDTDVRYWKKICTFDPSGHITTLSLSGNRLRHLTKEQWGSPGLLQHVVTLVLSNTDLAVSQLIDCILPNCIASSNLKHLHISGNGWGGKGTQELLSNEGTKSLLKQLTTLDLRYNDLGTEGAAALAELLQQEGCMWRSLFLEGNQLKDDGVTALVSTSAKLGPITELYLGQNQIGPVGAASLAQALPDSALQKLYLEGNQIGNAGALALTVVLEETANHRLEKLYADMNGIGKEESIRLGRSLNSATFIGDGGLFQD